MAEEKLTFSMKEACHQLGISTNLGYELARRGEFPGAIRLGEKRIIISRAQLEKYLGNNNNGAGAENAG